MSTLPLSVLDLAPVCAGTTAAESVRRTIDLVQLAEKLDYVRHWYAEHHGLASVASTAPEVLIANAAAQTRRIRVGSGGIMLPNHAPLRVAEAFHTLEALHPGRIDLGLGRAPGGDLGAARALRATSPEAFSALMSELLLLSQQGYPRGHWYHRLRALPDDVPLPPIWILGSSGASAGAAGSAGFGYSFASHFSPEPAAPALAAYRASFRPSASFPRPHAILAVSAVCAETDAEAQRLASSMELTWLRISRGEYLPLPGVEDALAHPWTEAERAELARSRGPVVIGSPGTVRSRIETLVAECAADEVMIVTNIHDHGARLRSYELIAAAFSG